MIKQFIKLFSRTLDSFPTTGKRQGECVSQLIDNVSIEEKEYQQALKQSKNLVRKVLLGESPQETLLKKCIKDNHCSEKVLGYSELAIWEFYCKKDFLNAIKSGEIAMQYVKKTISNDHMSIGHISLILAESCLEQKDYVRTLKYLNDAEESFHLNQEELSEFESQMNYYYSLKIGQLYSRLNMIEKSYFYAIMCLKTRKLSFQQKLPPCQIILNYYITKKDFEQANEFGQAILSQVSFKNILVKCRPQEIQSLCEIFKVMIELEQDQQKSYVLIEQFLLLLCITKSTDQQLIDQLNKKKSSIHQSLNNYSDLLFVLGFYGQKLKLETVPDQTQK